MTAAAPKKVRTGRALMDPRDFAPIVKNISHNHGVAVYLASLALDQAIALAMTVAAVDGPSQPKLWPSSPVDDAWRELLKCPAEYRQIAAVAGAEVDRVDMFDRAKPEQVIHTADVIESQGFVVHGEVWPPESGARSIAVVRNRLLTPASAQRR